jgi:hypothetical protein
MAVCKLVRNEFSMGFHKLQSYSVTWVEAYDQLFQKLLIKKYQFGYLGQAISQFHEDAAAVTSAWETQIEGFAVDKLIIDATL